MVKKHKQNLMHLHSFLEKNDKEIYLQTCPGSGQWIEICCVLGEKCKCAKTISRALLAEHGDGGCRTLSETTSEMNGKCC